MASEGLSESAAGGSRSSTVACDALATTRRNSILYRSHMPIARSAKWCHEKHIPHDIEKTTL